MTEFKYCVYCDNEPAICFNSEIEAMKFAREDTSMYESVRVEKTEISDDGEELNSEVIWEASGVIPNEQNQNDDPFNTEFPASDIEDINSSDDIDYDELAQQYEENPADWIDDNKLIKEAVDNLEEHENEVECKCCFDLFPKDICIKTEKGYICPKCHQEMESHQGTNLDLIDADPFDLSYEDPRDPEEEEEPEIKDEPVDENELRKHEAGIEEAVKEETAKDDDKEEIPEVAFTTSEVKEVAKEVAEKMIDNIETKGLNIDTEEWKEDATNIVAEKVDEKVEADENSEEDLEEHINDRPADIESDQKLQGADNAVVDCETDQKLIAHSEDEKPLDCKMEKPALEEPLAGEEVDVKLNEDLKVIIDFSEYKPWSGAVETYELIKDADKLDELEAYLEECYPDGVTATQINDILWFDSEQVLQYLGLGDTEEDEDVDESLKEYWWEDNDPMNWDDKEPLVYSCYYDYQLLGYLEYPYMGPEGYPTTIEADIVKYFELPEGYNPEDISWQNVEWEYQLDETKPLIKVDESLKEAVLDENIFSAIKKGFQKLGDKIKKTLYNVFKAKDPHDQMDEYVANVLPNKYYKVETRDRTKGEEWKVEDAKKFTKLDDAIKAAEAHSQNASIDARVVITNEEGTTITLLAYRNKKVIADNLKEFLSKIQSAAEAEGVGGETIDKVTLTFKAGKGKTKDGTEIAAEGTDITAKAEPNTKYKLPTAEECKFKAPDKNVFKSWQVEDKELNAGDELLVKADIEITANWEYSAELDSEISADDSSVDEEDAGGETTDATDTTLKADDIEARIRAKFPTYKDKTVKTILSVLKRAGITEELSDDAIEECIAKNHLDEKAMAETPFDSDIKVGDKIRIGHLEGEDNSYDGKEGEVEHIDSLGQLHGTWGGLAVIPGVDSYEVINEELNEAKAKPEADRVQSYNNGLKLAKAYGKPVIYGYTNSSYGNKFFELDDPIICDNVSDETKKFRQQYKSCNIAYVAYPSGSLIECLLEDLPEGTTEVDYVEYKHSYCHALEPKLEELKKIEDIEELRQAILDIINNDPQVNWTKKEKKFAAIVRHKKWKSVEDLKAYLDNSMNKAKEIKVSVDADGELVKTLAEEISFDENGDEIFTPEEQEEFDCDEWGYSNKGYDQYHHCGWCEEIFPESEMRHEVDFGWICDRCEAELKSHGGPLTFIED